MATPTSLSRCPSVANSDPYSVGWSGTGGTGKSWRGNENGEGANIGETPQRGTLGVQPS